MKAVEVDINIMRSQINQLELTLARTQMTLDKLTERVESLQAMWNGPAHEEFNRQYELDRQRMENMCQMIRNMIDGMQQACISYSKYETEVADVVTSIRV